MLDVDLLGILKALFVYENESKIGIYKIESHNKTE